MKKITITKKSSQTRVANLIFKCIEGALSIFSDKPEVSMADCGTWWKKITIAPTNGCYILTFAEIDQIRDVVNKYQNKYHGISCCISVRPYLANDNKTWLATPVMEIHIQRYEKDIFND